jgi:hypothetical protein
MEPTDLNAPRWPAAPAGGFGEAWYLVASEPRAGLGLWLRYAVDIDQAGAASFAVWGAWFEKDRTFSLRNLLPAAAISRTAVRFGAAELTADSSTGEVEAGGHALRWRLGFGQGAAAEDFVPAWLRPAAWLRGSGFLLPHPAATVTGAVEVDGQMIELQRVPASQAHIFGRSRWPGWAWSRCGAFAEDPEASIDLLDIVGPAGVRVPIFTFRFRGQVHRFAELPWIALSSSHPASPSWHFSAQDATLSVDGVVRAAPTSMVQVQYADPDGSLYHCSNSEVAGMEVRVRSRAFVGAPWRPEATLTSKSAACLEFCGHTPDARVLNLLVSAPAQVAQVKEAPTTGFVAS